jgi:enamine deaminase RidA (YjgF/YER057c/UK114 family)
MTITPVYRRDSKSLLGVHYYHGWHNGESFLSGGVPVNLTGDNNNTEQLRRQARRELIKAMIGAE